MGMTYAFYPRYQEISSITNDKQATVSFLGTHDFTPGEIVGFRVGQAFGMKEIDRMRGKVLEISIDSITVDIDTSTWTPFSLANLDEPGTSPPVVVPSSSGLVPGASIPQTNLADSFDNRRA